MRVINAIDPATAQRIRDRIAGKPLRVEPAKPKRAQPVKCLVHTSYRLDAERGMHTLQLPIAFNRAEYNAGRTPQHMRARWVKEKREMVWFAMHAFMPTFARCIPEGISLRVAHIEFVRLGLLKLDDDNLVAAFKAVRDALCSFLVWGDQCDENIRQIGRADDILKQRGVTWTYRQQKCEANPRLYGVRLILHCAPRLDVQSPDSETSPTS